MSTVHDLLHSLERAVSESLPPRGRATLLFSGGLDSSLLAHLLTRQSSVVELLAIGLAGSSDLGAARRSAELLGLPLNEQVLDRVGVLASARQLQRRFPGLVGNDLSVQVGMHLAILRTSRPQVFCGQGADELFVGYRHSLALTGTALEQRCLADLQKLRERDWPTSCQIGEELGRRLVAPYLEERFVEAVLRVPWEERRGGAEGKGLLRAIAREAGLPSDIVERPKKAFQYGSGIHRQLRSPPQD